MVDVLDDTMRSNSFISSTSSNSSRAQRRGSRTTNACEACKKRKTKCSGPPGPCQSCHKVDTFCHFNVRLDTRRKLAYKPTAVRERQQFILEGILQILKHNAGTDVQNLLSLIRSDARPQDIAGCLRHNLEILQHKGHIPDLVVDETDLVSLGLQGLFSHRAGRNGTKASNETKVDNAVPVGHFSEPHAWHAPSSNEDDNMYMDETATLVSSSSSEGTTLQFQPEVKHETPISLDISGTFNDFSSTDNGMLKHDVVMPAQPGQESVSSTSLDSINSGQGLAQWRNAAPQPMRRTQTSCESDAELGTVAALPVEQPRTPLDILTLQFRDDCKAMLAAGVSYEELTNGGKMDCELLFRDRLVQDRWNIPNWSCEIVRLIPPMLPETRLAAALCVARFMAFLIKPCRKTFNSLPGVLRPTEFQTRIPHDVSVNFIPIPMLRNCLLHKSANCLDVLGSYGYRVDWKGDWGDVGGATLASTGRWQYLQNGPHPEKVNSPGAVDGSRKKAIVLNPENGRRQLSKEFEECCWTFDNWSVSRDILRIWPDLAGHIRLV